MDPRRLHQEGMYRTNIERHPIILEGPIPAGMSGSTSVTGVSSPGMALHQVYRVNLKLFSQVTRFNKPLQHDANFPAIGRTGRIQFHRRSLLSAVALFSDRRVSM